MTNASGAPRILLYDWPLSPFCAKVRAVLEHKGLPFERIPVLARRREVARRGGVGKAPAIEVDGEFVVDSTDIVHFLERRLPDAPVLPASPADRALCHVLEDWADESLYFLGLYYNWHDPAGRRNTSGYFARTLLGRVLFWPYLRRIERQLWGQGTGRKSPAQVRADLDRNLDAIEVLLARSVFLLGAEPYLCDYALMSQLVYLGRAPALGDVLDHRPSTRAFLERMKARKGGASASIVSRDTRQPTPVPAA